MRKPIELETARFLKRAAQESSALKDFEIFCGGNRVGYIQACSADQALKAFRDSNPEYYVVRLRAELAW